MDWRVVRDHQQYDISETGELRRRRRSAIGGYYYQKPFLNARGYFSYVLCKVDARPVRISAAVLVADAFLGPRPPNFTVNHKDGNKTNNHWTNLEYLSNIENIRHAYRLGLMPKSRRPISKDTAQQIKAALANGQSRSSIQAEFGVSLSVVRNIARGYSGKRSTSEYASFLSVRMRESYAQGRTRVSGEQHPNSKLRDLDRQTIYTFVKQGRSRRSLAKQFHVSHTIINDLVRKLHMREEKNNSS